MDTSSIYVALLESNIAIINNNKLYYHTPSPKCINIASCTYLDKIYILCKNNDQYVLRQITINSENEYSTIDLLLLPDDTVFYDLWRCHENNLFIISKSYLLQVIFDSNEDIIVQMKKYELFGDSTIMINSFTYQDGYYYILAYKLNDVSAEKDISYSNYIFIFNDNFEYKQVYSLPYTELCKYIRYYGIYLLFIKNSEIIKYNLITNECDIFISIDINNIIIKSYSITKDNELICLLQNPYNYLCCDVCKIMINEPDKINYMYISKLLPIIKEVHCLNYNDDILLPISVWKKSYIQHININSIKNNTNCNIVDYLINIYNSLDDCKDIFKINNYTLKNIEYASLEEFINISDTYLSDITAFLPSFNNLQPKQLHYEDINNSEHIIKYNTITDIYNFCIKNNISPSGWFLYEKGYNMGWHTNLDKDIHKSKNKRQYIVLNQNVFGSSYFLYKHPISKQVHIVPDDKVSIIQFSFGTEEKPLWHAVYCKDGIRMSFGQIIE